MTVFSRKSYIEIVSREARRYALWELSRRAGIVREQFDGWRIHHCNDRDVIWINGAAPHRIEFPVAPEDFWDKLCCRRFEVVRASWMFPPPANIAIAIADFVVPFSSGLDRGRPLFYAIDSTTVVCAVDLLTSILLTLSRYEEAVSEARDVHGRFPASASLAAEHGFLERPIIDEYGFALQQVLSYLMPGWTASARELRVKLSHDIDEVGMPFRIRPVAGHSLVRRNPFATLRDLAAVMGAGQSTYLNCVKTICELSLERGLDSALYWKSPPSTDHDSGYSLFESKVQGVIRWASERGIEMGAHPGYYTYQAREKLREQTEYIRLATGERRIGGRQHYLRWSPATWEDWEACEFAYDSTVGYADRIGFRAGTCIPYKPWLLGQARPANLLEIPLTVMDATLAAYMEVPVEEQFDNIMRIVEKCRLVGGVFTFLWHNTSLVDPRYRDTYIRLINYLAGARRFAWRDEFAVRQLWPAEQSFAKRLHKPGVSQPC
jgi:uncharacterized protein DUF7033